MGNCQSLCRPYGAWTLGFMRIYRQAAPTELVEARSHFCRYQWLKRGVNETTKKSVVCIESNIVKLVAL